MAKNTSGYMALELPGAPEPVAPSGQLLEQAGSFRGQAAKIEGEKTADAIKFAGEVGKAAYESYQFSEAAKEAKNIMQDVVSPEFIGARAYDKLSKEKQLEAIEQSGDMPSAEFMNDLERARAAVEYGALSAANARTMLAAKMRSRIAANPGAAPWIRKAFQEYSGSGDWDIQELQGAFKEQKKERDVIEDERRKAKLALDKELAGNPEVQAVFANKFGLVGGQVLESFNSEQGQTYRRMAADIAAANAAQIAATRARDMTNLTDADKAHAAGVHAITQATVLSNDFMGIVIGQANATKTNLDTILQSPEGFGKFWADHKSLIKNSATISIRKLEDLRSSLVSTRGFNQAHVAEIDRRISTLNSIANDANGTSTSQAIQAYMAGTKFGTENAELVSRTITQALNAFGIPGTEFARHLNDVARSQHPDPVIRKSGQDALDNYARTNPATAKAMSNIIAMMRIDPTNPTVDSARKIIKDIKEGKGPETYNPNDDAQTFAVSRMIDAGWEELSALDKTTTPSLPTKEIQNTIRYSLKSFNASDTRSLSRMNMAISGANAPIDKFLGTLSDTEKKEFIDDVLRTIERKELNPTRGNLKSVNDTLNKVNTVLSQRSLTTTGASRGEAVTPGGAVTGRSAKPEKVESVKVQLFINEAGKVDIGVVRNGQEPISYSRVSGLPTDVVNNLDDAQQRIVSINEASSVYGALSSRTKGKTMEQVRKDIVMPKLDMVTPTSQKGTLNEAAPTSTTPNAATASADGATTPKATTGGDFVPLNTMLSGPLPTPVEKEQANLKNVTKELENAEKRLSKIPEGDTKERAKQTKVVNILKEEQQIVKRDLEARVLEYGPDGKRKVKQ